MRTVSRRVSVYTLVVCAALATSPSLAVPIVLKQYSAPGYTFANTPDTLLDGNGVATAVEKQYNYGGMGNYANMYSTARSFLLNFDLNAIPDKGLVVGVNSATLRIRRLSYMYMNSNYKAAQVAQDWVEGTGTWSGGTCNGAQWFNRNAGTVVDKSTFVSYGGGIYYIDGMTDLGDDPVNAGKKHVRPANDNTNTYNAQNAYTRCATLADLQALATTTRGYYWDSGAGRLYLNKNDINIRWYRSADHWTTAGGTITGSWINDMTYPGVPAIGAVWLQFNVTSVLQNWLISGQGSYGFKILESSSAGGNIATSEYATDQTLRPELVLDLAWDPAAAPTPVTNLATSNPSSSSITLAWTAPGADGTNGTASTYDIRYSTTAISEANWADAAQVVGEPTPLVAGTNQNMIVTGLSPSTTYYFAIKAADEAPHWSALSNVPSASTSDFIAPAAITDLATSTPATGSITLTWTAPGNDGNTGTAASYDIRYSTSTITEANWASATQAIGEPVPLVAGTSQSMTVSGLSPDTTYYFAIKTSNDVPETSTLSNVPSGKTLDVVAPAAVANLAAGSPTSRRITLTWTAPGDNDAAGTATSYDVRYATATIDEAGWGSATQVRSEPTPAAAGTSQSMVVSGLDPDTTYYFAIKTSDEAANTSTLSNVASGTTLETTPPLDKPLLGPRDFKYKGYYKVQTGGSLYTLEYAQGFTHRYVNGQLRFLTLAWNDSGTPAKYQLIEFAPPAALGGTVTTRTNTWPDIMAGTGLSIGAPSYWLGLWYEQAQNRLWTTWAVDYPSDTQGQYTKSLAVRTLNTDGTISNVAGPWGLAGVQQRQIYGGVQAIPEWFQDSYNVGPYAAGWGGYASRANVGVSLGPTFYTLPEPTGYPAGDIPTSDFKRLMYHSFTAPGGTGDWYANGSPTSYDRGVRNCDVKNEYDFGAWLSPAPDGLGRWTWGDSNWNTGCWIETPDKYGFVTVPQLDSGRVWYTMELNCTRRTAEIQVFDPDMLGEVALGTRPSWNTYPTYRWQITDDLRPFGLMGAGDGGTPRRGPSGATYDATTQTLYVYSTWGSGGNAYILVYDVDKDPAAVNDVAIAETAVAGTVSGTRANTETKDNVRQSIQEVVPASSDTSQLEHKWTFIVTPGSGIEFYTKAHRPDNTEGDDFVFAYSTNGTDWTNMLTVSRGSDDGTFQTYTLPGGTQGTVYVRVQDSDRTSGNVSLDTIYIDKMYFHSLPGTHLPGDINKDGYVNVGDLQLLVAAWGTAISNPSTWNPSADVNIDGYVNVGDLQLLVAHWGEYL